MLLTYDLTQSDLKKLGVTLKDGMEVTVYDESDQDEDVEIDGLARFGVIPKTNSCPCWYADCRGSVIRYVKRPK